MEDEEASSVDQNEGSMRPCFVGVSGGGRNSEGTDGSFVYQSTNIPSPPMRNAHALIYVQNLSSPSLSSSSSVYLNVSLALQTHPHLY